MGLIIVGLLWTACSYGQQNKNNNYLVGLGIGTNMYSIQTVSSEYSKEGIQLSSVLFAGLIDKTERITTNVVLMYTSEVYEYNGYYNPSSQVVDPNFDAEKEMACLNMELRLNFNALNSTTFNFGPVCRFSYGNLVKGRNEIIGYRKVPSSGTTPDKVFRTNIFRLGAGLNASVNFSKNWRILTSLIYDYRLNQLANWQDDDSTPIYGELGVGYVINKKDCDCPTFD